MMVSGKEENKKYIKDTYNKRYIYYYVIISSGNDDKLELIKENSF